MVIVVCDTRTENGGLRNIKELTRTPWLADTYVGQFFTEMGRFNENNSFYFIFLYSPKFFAFELASLNLVELVI